MHKRKHLEPHEISAFLNAAKKTKNGVRDYAIMLLIFRHGLRASELIDLRLEQIDLQTARFYPARLKNGTNCPQPIEGDEMRALRAYLRERSAHKLAASPFFFLSQQGPFTRQALNYLCTVIAKRARLPLKVHPHMLRHSCGYALADRNVATRTIQDYLGHKSIRHTVEYTASNPERFRNLWRGQTGRGGKP
jgi:type 1 fimbriae regulatory protein FimB